jgi:hypothetical protein
VICFHAVDTPVPGIVTRSAQTVQASIAMNIDPNSTSNDPLPDPIDRAAAARSLLVAGREETSALWRVVSTDGSSHVFQTKPALDNRRRPPVPAVAAPGARNGSAKPVAPTRTPLFDGNSSNLPTLIAEETPAAGAPDTGLATELTSVTQAWPTLSPGIRGAVMALIRAATTPRRGGPSSPPRHV